MMSLAKGHCWCFSVCSTQQKLSPIQGLILVHYRKKKWNLRMRARRVWIQWKHSKRPHIHRSTADCAGATWTRESRPQEVLQCAVLLSPVLYTRDNTYFFEFLFLWFWGCESKSLFLHQQTLSWIEMQGFHSCHCCGIECAKSWQTADVFQAESSLQCEEIFPLVQKKFLSFQKMM